MEAAGGGRRPEDRADCVVEGKEEKHKNLEKPADEQRIKGVNEKVITQGWVEGRERQETSLKRRGRAVDERRFLRKESNRTERYRGSEPGRRSTGRAG